MRVFYFGVWEAGHAGHFLHSPGGDRPTLLRWQLPFDVRILDAGLLPPLGPESEGFVRRSVVNGWTVLAFWDRSGDRRPSSNSAFVIEGEWSIEDGLKFARERFPTVFARFPFELKEAAQ